MVKPHCFPSFYACYLLKSVKSPRSTATYIGSTPNPPKRIRQHNGEITQGAWKTKKNRPWVMQMIVHGFPSRLAALQFEWAWQHPNISRHLRDEDGRALVSGDKYRYLKGSVQVVRMMLSRHPYNIWPLHVKLFTEEAVRAWNDVSKAVTSSSLPPGFTCVTELEGVDGKSGKVGSGRTGPIAVMDEQFTSSYLAKHTALLASNPHLSCSICGKSLSTYAVDPLTTALCPTPSCLSTSHLACLAEYFHTPPQSANTHLKSTAEETMTSSLVPRGGPCPSCTTYVLWGDIVRGCYRRSCGGAEPGRQEEDGEPGVGEMFESDKDDVLPVGRPPSKSTHKEISKLSKSKFNPKRIEGAENSEGEIFDFSDVEAGYYSDDADLPVVTLPRTAGRPPTASVLSDTNPPLPKSKPLTQTWQHVNAKAGPATQTPKAKSNPVRKPNPPSSKPRKPRKRLPTIDAAASSEGEAFDFGAVDRDVYSDDDPSAIPTRGGVAPKATAKAKPRSNPQSNLASMNTARPSKAAAMGPTRGRPPMPMIASPASQSLSPSPPRLKPQKRMAWKDGEVDFFDDSAPGDSNGRGADELARSMSALTLSSNADPPGVGSAFLRDGVIELSD